jgi:hypothetical protein
MPRSSTLTGLKRVSGLQRPHNLKFPARGILISSLERAVLAERGSASLVNCDLDSPSDISHAMDARIRLA